MTGPAPAEHVAGLYSGRRIALLTQHDKERVIAPVLDAALGCRVEWVNGFDTDLIGTFTRDIPRIGTQVEAARRKARIGCSSPRQFVVSSPLTRSHSRPICNANG